MMILKKKLNDLFLPMKFLIAGFILCPVLINGSFYYYDEFNDPVAFDTIWDMDYPYGRSGMITDNVTSSSREVVDGTLIISGDPLRNSGYNYHTIWIGRTVKMTNYNGQPSFSVSEKRPFGVDVIRCQSRIWHGDDGNWPEVMGNINIWLIQENGIPESNWFQLENYIFLYEASKYTWGDVSRWGYYKGGETRLFLTNLQRPNEKNINLASFLEHDYSGGSYNNNNIGIRITYNGFHVSFYINPDPFDQNSYPNEYCLLGRTSFPVTNHLRIMIGHENNAVLPNAEIYAAKYTNILMRSSADSSSSFLRPNTVPAGKMVFFTNTVRASFKPEDAGIGEMVLKIPAGFKNVQCRGVRVNGTALSLKKDRGTVGKKEVFIKHTESCLKIRFLQDKPLTGGVIKNDNAEIQLIFSAETPVSSKQKSYKFKTYIDCMKYDHTGYHLWSTTGRQKSSPLSPKAMRVVVKTGDNIAWGL